MSLESSYPVRLNELYRQVIMEHYRGPRNKGELPNPTVSIDLNNPTCGDEITLMLEVEDGTIKQARFSGQGCSISQASASMMTQAVQGKTVDEAEEMVERFKQMMHGDEEAGKPLGMHWRSTASPSFRCASSAHCCLGKRWSAASSSCPSERTRVTRGHREYGIQNERRPTNNSVLTNNSLLREVAFESTNSLLREAVFDRLVVSVYWTEIKPPA